MEVHDDYRCIREVGYFCIDMMDHIAQFAFFCAEDMRWGIANTVDILRHPHTIHILMDEALLLLHGLDVSGDPYQAPVKMKIRIGNMLYFKHFEDKLQCFDPSQFIAV